MKVSSALRATYYAINIPLAVRCGINEVEIDAQMAQRQPEPYWQDAFTRVERNYGSLLGANQVENSAA